MFFMQSRENRLRSAKQRLKVTLPTVLAVLLLIGALRTYTVHAVGRSGATPEVEWELSVYDVGRYVGNLETVSSHFYWVRARSTKNVSGTWEFAHRIHKGWDKGKGEEKANASIHGALRNMSTNSRYQSDTKTRTRRASYAGFEAGKYHVYAYTLLNVLVEGADNPDIPQLDEFDTFRLNGMEEPN